MVDSPYFMQCMSVCLFVCLVVRPLMSRTHGHQHCIPLQSSIVKILQHLTLHGVCYSHDDGSDHPR